MFDKKRWWVFLGAWTLSSLTAADNILDINSEIPSAGTGSTYISGFTFNNRKVTYENKTGLAIFEGDILLGSVDDAESWKLTNEQQTNSEFTTQSIIITGQRFRWTNNLVPYRFAANVPNAVRTMVLDAMDHWRDNTAMEFIERTANNAADHPDFVTVVSDENACWSFVGRQGGEQLLNVVNGCGFGAAVHEIGHAIGLWHEQSREDRNNFVRINWGNIQGGREHNFNQHITDGDDIGAYDYGSIMHYGAFAFSANNQPTITPLQPVAIGQRNGLSDLDIASIMQNYPEIIPVARIAQISYSVFLGNSLFLDGRQSFDPNGASLNYSWNLGDGTAATSPALQHLYTNRGTYNVALSVTDPDGFSDTDTATAYVYGFEVLIPAITMLL